ncbi:exopolysaccharide biosynthesis protein [Pusillimonas sp. CC-YST705]|uniref:Exopolysaccharide biosynthesis protein n=1 Tax=Mesopusillimonas faecipullorum TaxID=2755040 RepID=A0ABS8CFA6_9BURK|nr:exopolysaccharide biosynthesis protein [Mesopusillimonas faecipullorum]MCB5364517.1 exopolysaccharide biosynthesis protein [Mesopusillimonas faecipullorum]
MHFDDTSVPLSTTLSQAIDGIKGETVTLRQLMAAIGEQGLLMLCAIATLPFLIPVSIPGVSTVFGAAIVLLSVAITLNRMPWLPQRILDRQLETAKLVPALHKGVRIVSRIDAWVRPRAPGLTSGYMLRLNGLTLIFGGVLLMAPFGFVPLSNTAPAIGILFLTIGMLQRDGLFVALGYLATLLTVIYFSVLIYGAWHAGAALLS